MSGEKTKKHLSSKQKKRRFILKVSLFIFLILALIVTLFLYLRYGDDLEEAKNNAVTLVAESTEDTFRASETSIVYDVNGKQIATLTGDKDMYYVEINTIPKAAVNAMLATEDRKFYKHNGIDIKAIAAAAVSLVKNNGELRRGGSTITQQLARNVFLNNAKEWSRKIKEMFIALELEKKYEKDEIMEFYLNNIYFANGYYGIEAASRGYFNKSCNNLSLAEVAFVCSIPNSPTRYDPLVNYDNTLARQKRILEQMHGQGFINEEEYKAACAEEIVLNVPKQKVRNYIETYVMNCTVRALMKQSGFEFRYDVNISEDDEYNEAYNEMYTQCQQSMYREGYRIFTSIDREKQRLLQTSINEQLSAYKEKGEDGMYEFQGAGICIDNENGKVVAVVGGRSQSQITGYTFNRAYQSYRQPGSAIKPVAVYGPAFDNGYTPVSTMKDSPIKDGPQNSNGKYMGTVSLRTAVERSINTIAWNLFNEITPKTCLSYLTDMNFSKLVSGDYTLAASLGGLTKGVSPVELASAYAALENDGVFREPTCIMAITDSAGNKILNDTIFDEKSIYTEETARALTDVMQGVLTKGTAAGHALSGMSCAGKTGTTNDKKDGWFAGYTPYYTTVVWVGCDTPKTVSNLLGNTYPLYIWKDFMEDIHEGLPDKEFPKSEYSSAHKPAESPEPSKDPNESADPGTDPNAIPTQLPTDMPVQVPDPVPQITAAPQVQVTEAPRPTDVPATEVPQVTKQPEAEAVETQMPQMQEYETD